MESKELMYTLKELRITIAQCLPASVLAGVLVDLVVEYCRSIFFCTHINWSFADRVSKKLIKMRRFVVHDAVRGTANGQQICWSEQEEHFTQLCVNASDGSLVVRSEHLLSASQSARPKGVPRGSTYDVTKVEGSSFAGVLWTTRSQPYGKRWFCVQDLTKEEPGQTIDSMEVSPNILSLSSRRSSCFVFYNASQWTMWYNGEVFRHREESYYNMRYALSAYPGPFACSLLQWNSSMQHIKVDKRRRQILLVSLVPEEKRLGCVPVLTDDTSDFLASENANVRSCASLSMDGRIAIVAATPDTPLQNKAQLLICHIEHLDKAYYLRVKHAYEPFLFPQTDIRETTMRVVLQE